MKKYCTNCGAQLTPDARFCNRCGTPTTKGAEENASSYRQPPAYSQSGQGMGGRKYTGVRTLLIVLFSFVALFALGFVLMTATGGGEDGYYAWLFVNFAAIVTCLALIPMYVKRKHNFEQAVNPNTQFCQWRLGDALIERTAKAKLDNAKSRNKSLLILMSIIFAVVTVIFVIAIDEDERGGFILIMLVIYAFIAAVALTAPTISYRRTYLKAKEVYLGENAAIIGRELHIFSSLLARYVSAGYDDRNRLIIVNYEVFNRTGWVPTLAQIPVPAGYEQKALEYIELLNRIHG